MRPINRVLALRWAGLLGGLVLIVVGFAAGGAAGLAIVVGGFAVLIVAAFGRPRNPLDAESSGGPPWPKP